MKTWVREISEDTDKQQLCCVFRRLKFSESVNHSTSPELRSAGRFLPPIWTSPAEILMDSFHSHQHADIHLMEKIGLILLYDAVSHLRRDGTEPQLVSAAEGWESEEMSHLCIWLESVRFFFYAKGNISVIRIKPIARHWMIIVTPVVLQTLCFFSSEALWINTSSLFVITLSDCCLQTQISLKPISLSNVNRRTFLNVPSGFRRKIYVNYSTSIERLLRESSSTFLSLDIFIFRLFLTTKQYFCKGDCFEHVRALQLKLSNFNPTAIKQSDDSK